MARIRVRYFGPISEGLGSNDGWIDIRHVTLLIGNQGSGKSTLAKLYATFSWIEKALVRGDQPASWFERKNRLANRFLPYHRLEGYESPRSRIEYQGDAFHLHYEHEQLTVQPAPGARGEAGYALPQIMYVPAERNFLAYVRSPRELKLSSDALKEFLTEFDQAKLDARFPLRLPLNDASLDYDRLNDQLSVQGPAYRVRLSDASSGFQSATPLFLVSEVLAGAVANHESHIQQAMSVEQLERFRKQVAQLLDNTSMTDEQHRAAISVLSARYKKTAFINIVEEPEQNLFPSSQWNTLAHLLGCNVRNTHNRLLLTTHSPYLLGYLNLATQAHALARKLHAHPKHAELATRLDAIIPPHARLAAEDLSAYQADENDGSLHAIPREYRLLSDTHQLNALLRQGNALFDQLLDIEEALAE